MIVEAAGAAGHTLRVPALGLEAMSLTGLIHRIKLAAQLPLTVEITKVFLPSGAVLSHPSQLTPGRAWQIMRVTLFNVFETLFIESNDMAEGGV